MIQLNIRRVFALRGIEKPLKLMIQAGISRATASNLLNNSVDSINSTHLEKLCEMLNCEPNDLYQWTPSANTQNVETHPLKNLRRTQSVQNLSEMLKNVPLDKIGQIENLLNNVNSNE